MRASSTPVTATPPAPHRLERPWHPHRRHCPATWIQDTKGRGMSVMIAPSLVAISATLSFGAMNAIIVHRKTGRTPRLLLGWERMIATGAFVTGLGVFMSEIGRTVQ